MQLNLLVLLIYARLLRQVAVGRVGVPTRVRDGQLRLRLSQQLGQPANLAPRAVQTLLHHPA